MEQRTVDVTYVRALKRHQASGTARLPGDVYPLCCCDVDSLVRAGLVERVAEAPDWWAHPRRELRLFDHGRHVGPVVACLNIWNDTPALRQTIDSWVHQVDALVVADGPYALTGQRGLSTDGLEDFMASAPVPVQWVPMPGPVWIDQVTKRTALLQAAALAHPDALLLIVDADERLEGDLRALPVCDVGWVTVRNPTLYRRRSSQPRLIRAQPGLRYDARHHWLYAGDQLLATHQYGGVGVLHRATGVGLTNHRGAWQDGTRQQIKSRYLNMQYLTEREAVAASADSDRKAGRREALRVVQIASLDPAAVGARLHTALNTTTPHASLLFTAPRSGADPFQAPTQFNVGRDKTMLSLAWDEADVVHWHLTYQLLRDQHKSWKLKPWRVIHHHGTMFRTKVDYYEAMDRVHAGLRLVSTLELTQYAHDLHWLPNPMAVAEYRRLRAGYQPGPTFRVAHSPSKRHLKGTEQFLAACATLAAKGLPIEPVLIEGMTYAQSVAAKATCDAVFDSFWLGIQCSGLEGAAMGLPVIAGDAFTAGKYREIVGHVPYTYADDEATLTEALERLVVDADWRRGEAERVATYCETWHDEAAVALRYLDLLDLAFNWRQALTGGRIRQRPLVARPPVPRTPGQRIVTVPAVEAPLVRVA